MLATLLQQWARKYIRVTQPRFSPHKRAQVHAFFSEGVETLHLPWAVQILPTLLHLSLFLFLAGVVVFLGQVNQTIYKLVLTWACLCAALYGCITFVPIIRHDSPYYTPLSSSVWFIVNGITFVVLRALRWPRNLWSYEVFKRLRESEERYRQALLQGMQRTVDGTAQNSPSRVDGRVFMRTFDSLEKDDELELFFMGLPGFRSSKVVADPLPGLTRLEKRRLFEELLELMDRTLSSDLLNEKIKNRRAMICAKAINPADISGAFRWILDRILTDDQYDGLKTADFGHIVRRWGISANKRTAITVQTIVSVILVRARKRDLSWFILATEQLGVSEPVLRRYAVSDNSVSLANLIHITRGLFSLLGEEYPLRLGPIVLEAVSKFDIQDTSLELQRDFCALWNQIVARGGSLDAREILKWIRNVYVDLHKGTDAAPTHFSESTGDLDWVLDRPSSYPSCHVPDHHPDSTPHIHQATASTTIARATLHDNTALVPAPLASIPSAPSTSVPAPLRVDENITYVPPLDNHTPVPVSLHPAHPTTVEDHHIPTTSSDPTSANATQGGLDTLTRTMPHFTLETSTPTPPLVSTSPPSSISLQHNADPRTSSGVPDFPPSPPIPVPENIFPTGPPLSSDSPVTRSDHAHSLPESHSSMLGTAPRGTPQPTSVPGLGAAAEGGGSAKAILHKDKDALAPSLSSRVLHFFLWMLSIWGIDLILHGQYDVISCNTSFYVVRPTRALGSKSHIFGILAIESDRVAELPLQIRVLTTSPHHPFAIGRSFSPILSLSLSHPRSLSSRSLSLAPQRTVTSIASQTATPKTGSAPSRPVHISSPRLLRIAHGLALFTNPSKAIKMLHTLDHFGHEDPRLSARAVSASDLSQTLITSPLWRNMCYCVTQVEREVQGRGHPFQKSQYPKVRELRSRTNSSEGQAEDFYTKTVYDQVGTCEESKSVGPASVRSVIKLLRPVVEKGEDDMSGSTMKY
ncbi:hypothetical protein BJY52DRAFT_1416389 [Lactarius psammicola]|nr:hypothetical protein BJY52DRAFT_1416389 [Lactarius psammicola]